jgi:hypothetical protein
MSTGYRSYLLRVWQEGSGWRFTMTNLGDDRQRGFASLEKLIDFVHEQMAEIAASESHAHEEQRRGTTRRRLCADSAHTPTPNC